MNQRIEKLKEKHSEVCRDYINLFAEKHNLCFEFWISDKIGEMACFNGIYFFIFTDIVYDINTQQPGQLILEWHEDQLDNQHKSINFESYSKGLRFEDIQKI